MDNPHEQDTTTFTSTTTSKIVIGSTNDINWPFCPVCGATVIADAHGSVRCPCCPFITHLSKILPTTKLSLITVSNDTMMPIWAKSDGMKYLVIFVCVSFMLCYVDFNLLYIYRSI